MLNITKQDVTKRRWHHHGLGICFLELVLLLASAVANGIEPLFIAVFAMFAVTAIFTAAYGGIEDEKKKALETWQELGERLKKFPITAEEQRAYQDWAHVVLRNLAEDATKAFKIEDDLKEQARAASMKYASGHNEDDYERFAQLKRKLEAAHRFAETGHDQYLRVWKLFVEDTFILPQLAKKFDKPENFRAWVEINMQPVSVVDRSEVIRSAR